MDWAFVLPIVVGVLLTIWVFSRSGPPSWLPDGALELRPTIGVGIFGVIVGSLSLGVVLASLIWGGDGSVGEWIVFFGIGGAIFAGGLYYLGYYLRTRVVVNTEGLTKTDIWGKRQYMAWEDVRRIYFSNNKRAFIVVSHDHEEISVGAKMRGLKEFQEQFEKRLDPSKYQGAREGYAKWKRWPH